MFLPQLNGLISENPILSLFGGRKTLNEQGSGRNFQSLKYSPSSPLTIDFFISVFLSSPSRHLFSRFHRLVLSEGDWRRRWDWEQTRRRKPKRRNCENRTEPVRLFQVVREEGEFKPGKSKSNQINAYGTSNIEFFYSERVLI